MNLFTRLKWLRGKIKKPSNRQKKGEQSATGTESGNGNSDGITSQQSKVSASSVYHSGRRFQAYKDCAYVLPNDDAEIDRLHLQHWLMKSVLGRNFSSPIDEQLEKGIKVIDAGCGGGTWVLEMANTYPNSHFTGIDVSAAWPTEIRPPNSDFIVSNIIHELPLEENSIDFAYMRFLGLGISNSQFPVVLANIFKVLKPGGWIELVDFNGEETYKGEVGLTYWNALMAYLATRGFDDGVVKKLDLKLQDVGFVNIDGMTIRIPVGSWGGKIGMVFQEDVEGAYAGLKPALQERLGFSSEEYDENLKKTREENNEVKQVVNWVSFWAQKPPN